MQLDRIPTAFWTVAGNGVSNTTFTSRREARSFKNTLVAAGYTGVHIVRTAIVVDGTSVVR